MKLNNLFAPGLIVLGTGLIAISVFSPQKRISSLFQSKAIANVIEKDGTVFFQNNQMPLPSEVESKQSLAARDLLRTSEESEILVEFKNGGQARLTEKSEALIDLLNNGQPLIVVRAGEVIIEKFGDAPGFWIRQNGQLYSATDYALLVKDQHSKLTEALPSSQTLEQISQIEIENTLNAKKNDFFRCYGQLIQRMPQATGQVLLSFTIEKIGRTSQVEVSSSEINDTVFKSCLIEIVSRTRFRVFNGAPVTTVFPIRFE